MSCGRAILAATLAGVIAACGATGAPSAPVDGTPIQAAGATNVRPTTTPVTSPGAQRSLSPSTTQQAATPTPLDVPPKPAGVKFDTQAIERDESGQYADVTQTVTWRTPRSDGVEIRVYGVTRCIAEPRDPAPDTSGPCLVTGTPLPESVRTLLGTAPASKGAVSWSWTEETGCDIGLPNDPEGPQYHSVVLAAYNASGHSIFAIAEPGTWWEPGPNDVVC